VLDQAPLADGAAEIGEEEDALQANPGRREGVGGDPLLRRLVPVHVVDTRVTRIAGLEALDLDVAIVDEIAAGHALHGAASTVERIAGGIGSEAGGGGRHEETRQDREESSHES
jgi:hypothetical protein